MITVPDLKAHLRVEEDSTDEDALIADLEAAAVNAVENYCDRHFGGVESVTEYLEGTGTDQMWLRDAPSTAPTTMTERSYPGAVGITITATDDDGFYVRGRRLVRKGGGKWLRGHEYETAYSRGYSFGSEPAEIRVAVMQLVTWWYEQRIPVALGTVAPAVPWHIEQSLSPWRNIPV